MTGSLLQIVSTGVKDIFLTIDPQITFFKIVYLRHTPFSIDIIEDYFNTIPNFGEEGFCQISKYGDLISNIFLKIVLPSVQIQKENNIIQNNDNLNRLIQQYADKIDKFIIFMSSAMIYLKEIKSTLNNLTTNYNIMKNLIISLLSKNNDILIKYNSNKFEITKIANYNIFFNFDILNNINDNFKKYNNSQYDINETKEYINTINKYLDDYIFYQTIYFKYLIDTRDYYQKILNINTSKNYDFAWVKTIGFALINYITIEIGGQEIDRLTSDILNNWYELANSAEKISLLDEMIGNINKLTTYDSESTPKYTLIIPLSFWFCKYQSQTIASISLKYHDIIIRLKFNELYKCCYFEPEEYNMHINLNINDIIKLERVSLLIEYINLGEDERKKFGSFANETLIEQNKILTFNNINTPNVLIPLDYVNSLKELIWTVQKTSNINLKLWNDYTNIDIFKGKIYLHNNDNICIINILNDIVNYNDYINGYINIYNSKYYNGKYKILNITLKTIMIKINYTFIYSDNITFILYLDEYNSSYNLITNENIQIFGNNLLSIRDCNYFTLVQNFQNHSLIPKNIHTYSFCINTEEFQPSGSLNFSVIDNKNLYLEFNDTILKQLLKNNDSLTIKIIARSYNILKIEQGMGKVYFGL